MSENEKIAVECMKEARRQCIVAAQKLGKGHPLLLFLVPMVTAIRELLERHFGVKP